MLQNSVSKIILHNATPTNVIDDFKGEFSFSGILPMPFEIQMLRDYEFNLHDPLRANHAEYVKILSIVQDKLQVSSAREWCEKFWHCRFDCFNSFIADNKIQFKTSGSIPMGLIEPWIASNKISCDIANLQDDFEYWSFATYKDGVLVKFEDTLDDILLKVLMMIDEEKPNAETFKRIYKECNDRSIPKSLLKTYMSGEAYMHTF